MDMKDIAIRAGVSIYTARKYYKLFFDVEGEKEQFSIGAGNKIIDVIKTWRTGSDVCRELGISRQYLYSLRKDKNIPCQNFGKKTYYNVDVVRKYVKRLSKDEN